MENKKKETLIISVLSLVLVFLFCYSLFKGPCLIKLIFNISCPTCGMTRAFISLFHFKIIESFSYNILALPMIIIIISLYISYIYDLITNKKILTWIIDKLVKYYYVIIILLIINMIINNLRGI